MTIWSSTQNPHILRTFIAALTGLGQDQVRAIAPGSGRRLRRQDQHLRRRVRRGGDLQAPRHSGEVGGGPLGSVRGDDARPRHSRLRRPRGEARRHGARPEDAADRRYRRLQHAADRRHPDAHDDDGERDLQHSGDPHHADRSLHEQDADRCVSRRRPSRSDLLRRARDGHAGARAEDGSGGASPKELHPAESVSVHDADGRDLRLGRLREGARPGAEDRPVGAAEGGARRGARAGAAGRSGTRDVRRGVRHRSLVVASDRRLGTLAGDDRARRPDQRDHRRVAARAGQRNDVRADARRPVRRAARTHHDPSRRYRRREAGHRHLRQPVAGGGRHRAAHGGRAR